MEGMEMSAMSGDSDHCSHSDSDCGSHSDGNGNELATGWYGGE